MFSIKIVVKIKIDITEYLYIYHFICLSIIIAKKSTQQSGWTCCYMVKYR